MPELAEIMIMSEYINSSVDSKKFKSIEQSKETKVKRFNLPEHYKDGFSIKSESRGKGLTLILNTPEDEVKLSFSMGMTGNWSYVPTREIPKHSHLMFHATDKYSLCLVDVRRFAKWKLGEDTKRGPCPVKEHNDFKTKIINSVFKSNPSKLFQKPIYEVLMDQRYFNGIGNYLRAEILYRLDINPFISAYEAITEYHEQLFKLCKEVAEEAYIVGGGELKDWQNPYNRGYGRGRINENMKKEIPHRFRDWLQCYQKGSSIIDSKGRKFWFNQKYAKHVKPVS